MDDGLAELDETAGGGWPIGWRSTREPSRTLEAVGQLF
jgi:hypothetical protein